MIQGRAYFPHDVPAQEIQITALDPAGRELGRTKTDREGKFVLTPDIRERCEIKIVAASDDGHGADYTVHAAELPADLPLTPAAGPAAASVGRPAARPAEQPADPTQTAGRSPETPAQVVELREQVFDYEYRLRFRDVLGGLGYILGLAGVACYLLSLRRRQR